jgi:hypothetical protein
VRRPGTPRPPPRLAARRYLLRENNRKYDKGALAVVLEDIMGKGLIPAGALVAAWVTLGAVTVWVM